MARRLKNRRDTVSPTVSNLPSSATKRVARTVAVLMLAVAVGVVVGVSFRSRSAPAALSIASSSGAGKTALALGTLLSLPPDRLAKIDLAEANLIVGIGLPGGDGGGASLDIGGPLSRLAEWTSRVRGETERHLHKFRRDPAAYNNSEAYF